MMDKRKKIWFFVMGLIVVVSVLAVLISNGKENRKNNSNQKNNTSTVANNSNLNQNVQVVNNVTVGNSTYKNQQSEVNTTGLSEAVKQKIETYLNNYYKEIWKSVNGEVSDEELNYLLEQQNGNMGFNQSFSQVFINNKVVSYSYSFQGSLGGVSREIVDGITFDVNTGEVIKMSDIVTSKDSYKAACKKYVYEELKNDKRYSMLNEGYEKVVDSHIDNLEGYITREGIVCVIIQKYEISTGAAGSFTYTVPFEKVKDYIDSQYVS